MAVSLKSSPDFNRPVTLQVGSEPPNPSRLEQTRGPGGGVARGKSGEWGWCGARRRVGLVSSISKNVPKNADDFETCSGLGEKCNGAAERHPTIKHKIISIKLSRRPRAASSSRSRKWSCGRIPSQTCVPSRSRSS